MPTFNGSLVASRFQWEVEPSSLYGVVKLDTEPCRRRRKEQPAQRYGHHSAYDFGRRGK